jgi:hypothetical protein
MRFHRGTFTEANITVNPASRMTLATEARIRPRQSTNKKLQKFDSGRGA